jgi:hypothetical protein
LTNQDAIIVTTINPPTRAVIEIQNGALASGATFYVIGDSKSPPDFSLPGAKYFNLDEQRATGLRFAELCPTRHYARKNIGYLAAMRDGAQVIVETDDDNIPREGFWTPRERVVTAPLATEQGWCNVYGYFSDQLIWPRGLPLNRVQDKLPPLDGLSPVSADCPIQQGLADENPDVDAIYRLLLPLPQNFLTGRTVILDKGVWCPFNSQNTTFWRDAFPLLYLPYHCSFRMTDIWRSFVAQRLMWENDWRLMFHGSTVYQERNEHDLMRDFAEEVPGYLNNERIRKTLEDLPLNAGVAALPDNLRRSYKALIDLGVVGAEEASLLDAYLADIDTIAAAT